MEHYIAKWVTSGVLFWSATFLLVRSLFRHRSFDFCNRVVSAIHAVVAVSFASFSVQDWSCPLCPLASRSSPLQMKALAVTLSYLIYDLACCLFDRNPKTDNSIHHVVSIVGIGAGLAYEMCGSEMVASMWITEISSPFLHMRELLKELGHRDTDLNFTVDVKLNASIPLLVRGSRKKNCGRFNGFMAMQVLFAAIFSVARMVGGPYLTYVTLKADNPLLIKVQPKLH